MTDPMLIFDAVLAAGIVWMAWVSLASTDPFRMVVTFMVFGTLVALAWVRVNAPDVALAEAAVGAGVTGALFLRTVGRLRRSEAAEHPGPLLTLVAATLAIVVTAALAVGLLVLRQPNAGFDALVAQNLGASGVTNPVTAVL